VITAVVTSVVRCRQLLQSDTLSLCLTIFVLCSPQVNNGLRDVFPARAGSNCQYLWIKIF